MEEQGVKNAKENETEESDSTNDDNPCFVGCLTYKDGMVWLKSLYVFILSEQELFQ